jgi:hypothetical protein
MSSFLSSFDSTSYSSNYGSQERCLFPFIFRCFLQKTLDYCFKSTNKVSFSCGVWEAFVFTCVWFWVQVDAEQLLSFFGCHREDFNFPSPLQSEIYVQNYLSDEEDLTEFADSLLVDPDEYGTKKVKMLHYFSQMTTTHQGHQGKLMLRIAVTEQLIMPMER